MKKSSKYLRYIAAGLAVMLWGTSVSCGRGLVEDLGIARAGTWIFFYGALFSATIWIAISSVRGTFTLRGKSPWSDPNNLYSSIAFTVYALLFYTAIAWASTRDFVPEIGLVNQLWMVCTVLFAVLFFGKRARWTLLLCGALVAVIGTVFAKSNTGFKMLAELTTADRWALLLAVLAAFTWGFYNNFNNASDSSGTVLPVQMFGTSAVFCVLSFFSEFEVQWDGWTLGMLIWQSSVATTGFLLWEYATRDGDILRVSAIAYLLPLISSICSAIGLWVSPSLFFWLGCLLITLGAYLSDKSRITQP